MKIFIESSAIFSERSGVGQVAKRLTEAYHKQYPDQQIRLFGFKFFIRKFIPPITPDNSLKFRLIRWIPGRIYTGLFKKGMPMPMDLLIGASPKDVIIFPNFVRWPLAYNKRSMTFVHDLSFVLYGQYSSPPNRDYMLKYVPPSINKSQHILTVSESSKKDIAKHYNVPADRISVIYASVDPIFYRREQKEVDAIRKKFNLPEKYILFVSSLEPRKNLAGLLDAYEQLSPKLRDEYSLVLAGGKGWLNEEIHAKADKLVAKGMKIVRTGYVADEDLPAIFSGATVFAFPSFYEGFGIPPLEAMACGVPVITANNSSLPEVVGDAAELVNAEETSTLVKALTKVLKDKNLQIEMVKKGYRQASKFTPERSAQQLHEAIQKII